MKSIVFCFALIAGVIFSDNTVEFNQANDAQWVQVFADDCTGDWNDKWFLDGEIASVENSTDGMKLAAGPQFLNDAHHMVLWTKQEFSGDIKIEFNYTKLDFETRCVSILYFHATGSGDGPYAKDITKWNELRRIPAMKMYFNHMNLYHISFAAFPNFGAEREQYIRGRRYIPSGAGLKNTDLIPDYFPQDFFEPGVKHHITVIKRSKEIFMRVENPAQTLVCKMSNPDLPDTNEGRIGLRQMYMRTALFSDVRVYQVE